MEGYDNYKRNVINRIYDNILCDLNNISKALSTRNKLYYLANIVSYNKKIKKITELTYNDYILNRCNKYFYDLESCAKIYYGAHVNKGDINDPLVYDIYKAKEQELYNIQQLYNLTLLNKYYGITKDDVKYRGFPKNKLDEIYSNNKIYKLIFDYKSLKEIKP